MSSSVRGTIFLEEARVLSQLAYDAEQFVLRVEAPRGAAHAQPGSFAHLACDANHPDAPAAVDHARAIPSGGWVEFLPTRSWGTGLHALAARKAGRCR